LKKLKDLKATEPPLKLQPQYILHGVETGLPFCEPLSRAKGAAGESVAAVSTVDKLETLDWQINSRH
jgi:hypothetical protein